MKTRLLLLMEKIKDMPVMPYTGNFQNILEFHIFSCVVYKDANQG